MPDGAKTLSQQEMDRFCIEELILRAAGIRHALAGLGEGPGPSAPAPADDFLGEIVVELRELGLKSVELAEMLQSRRNRNGHPPAGVAPLILMDPQPPASRRYALEKVLEKLSAIKD